MLAFLHRLVDYFSLEPSSVVHQIEATDLTIQFLKKAVVPHPVSNYLSHPANTLRAKIVGHRYANTLGKVIIPVYALRHVWNAVLIEDERFRVFLIILIGQFVSVCKWAESPADLPGNVVSTSDAHSMEDGESLLVAGWVIARQHPRGSQGAVFVTIEDEFSDLQLIIWPHVMNDVKYTLKKTVIIAEGKISRWDGTTNLVVSCLHPVSVDIDMPMGHDWH